MKRYSRISYRSAHNFSYKVCMNRHIFCFIFVHNFLWSTQKINRIVLIKSFAWIHVENGPCGKCEFINRGEWLCWILNWVWVGFMLNIDFCTVAWRQKWNRLENHRLITYSYFSTKLNRLDIGQLNNIIRIRMKFNKEHHFECVFEQLEFLKVNNSATLPHSDNTSGKKSSNSN